MADVVIYLNRDPSAWGWNVSSNEVEADVGALAERCHQRLAEAIGRYMRTYWPGVRYRIREQSFPPVLGEAFTQRGCRALEDLQHAMETLWLDVLEEEAGGRKI